MQSNFELSEYFKLSRDSRQDLFFNFDQESSNELNDRPLLTSRAYLFLVLGTISQKRNVVLTSAVMAMAADLVTDGRANMLTWILTYAYLIFVLRNQSIVIALRNLFFILFSFLVFLLRDRANCQTLFHCAH